MSTIYVLILNMFSGIDNFLIFATFHYNMIHKKQNSYQMGDTGTESYQKLS